MEKKNEKVVKYNEANTSKKKGVQKKKQAAQNGPDTFEKVMTGISVAATVIGMCVIPTVTHMSAMKSADKQIKAMNDLTNSINSLANK